MYYYLCNLHLGAFIIKHNPYVLAPHNDDLMVPSHYQRWLSSQHYLFLFRNITESLNINFRVAIPRVAKPVVYLWVEPAPRPACGSRPCSAPRAPTTGTQPACRSPAPLSCRATPRGPAVTHISVRNFKSKIVIHTHEPIRRQALLRFVLNFISQMDFVKSKRYEQGFESTTFYLRSRTSRRLKLDTLWVPHILQNNT